MLKFLLLTIIVLICWCVHYSEAKGAHVASAGEDKKTEKKGGFGFRDGKGRRKHHKGKKGKGGFKFREHHKKMKQHIKDITQKELEALRERVAKKAESDAPTPGEEEPWDDSWKKGKKGAPSNK